MHAFFSCFHVYILITKLIEYELIRDLSKKNKRNG
jgi:hypothetical protein